MPQIASIHATLNDWIADEAIAFTVGSPESFNAAVDKLIAAVGESVELLGLGEALHGSEELLILRNRLFERLVAEHGYTAIALESSFPRGHIVNEYVAGRGPDSYAGVQERGFSHWFGRSGANQELVEWMRRYNAEPQHRVKLRFYGFDSPTEMVGTDSPRQLLTFVLDYLGVIGGDERRQRIENLLGEDAAWENPAASYEPAKSIGLSPAANALRIETEDLIEELKIRRPELIAKSDADAYLEASHYVVVARQLLNYHGELARASSKRLEKLLGIRDAMMADNLAYMVIRERGRGKVFAFAHNCHLKRGPAQWQLGSDLLTWWPAGSHLHHMLGPRYVVIGTAVGMSDAHGIGPPEAKTLEARLSAAPGPARFIATQQGRGLSMSAINSLPPRTGSIKNQSYFPLTPQCFTDFDWIAAVDRIT